MINVLTVWLPQITGYPNVWSSVAFAFYISLCFFFDILWDHDLSCLKGHSNKCFPLHHVLDTLHLFGIFPLLKIYQKLPNKCNALLAFRNFCCWSDKKTYLDLFCKGTNLKAFVTPYLIKKTIIGSLVTRRYNC